MTTDAATSECSRVERLRRRALKGAGFVAFVVLLIVVLNLVSSWIWGRTTIWNYYRSQWSVEAAVTQKEAGDTQAALRSLDRAIELNPKNAEAYYRRAVVHYEANQSNEAIADLLEAYAHARSDAMRSQACLMLGMVQHENGNLRGAIEALDRAVQYDPQLYDAYIVRSAVYAESDALDRAMADIERAIALRPDFAEAYANRAGIHAQQEQWERARADADKAIDLDGNTVQARAVRGMVNFRQQQFQEAVADLSVAIAGDSSRADYFELRAAAYRELGAVAMAEADAAESSRLQETGTGTVNNP